MPSYTPHALPTPPSHANDPLLCAIGLGKQIRTDKGTEGVRRYVACIREFLPETTYHALCRALDIELSGDAFGQQRSDFGGKAAFSFDPGANPRALFLQMLMQMLSKNAPPNGTGNSPLSGGFPMNLLMQFLSQK